MSDQNDNNVGDVIAGIIEDAVNSQQFERLNDSIRSTIDTVFDELNIDKGAGDRSSYGAGDWAAGRRGRQFTANGAGQWSESKTSWSGEKTSWSASKTGSAESIRKEFSNKTKDLASALKGQDDYMTVTPGSFMGPLATVFGGIGTGINGLMTVAGTIITIGSPDAAGIAACVIFAALTAGFGYLTWWGRGLSGRNRRFKTYVKVLAGRKYCSIRELAAAVGKSEKFVADDLRKMIEKNYFYHGHVDLGGSTFMLDDETYQQYLAADKSYQERTEREAEERRKTEAEKLRQAMSEDGAKMQKSAADDELSAALSKNPELAKALSEGENYIRKIREANDAIPGEEITRKLDRLELLMKKIFAVLMQKPDQLPKLRKFMNYYMPTTDKLVQTYRQLDAQPVEGENIQKAKAEIEGTLDTINDAYEKLLDNFFAEAAMDVSTDISVLQNLLAQEGLTNQPFASDNNFYAYSDGFTQGLAEDGGTAKAVKEEN